MWLAGIGAFALAGFATGAAAGESVAPRLTWGFAGARNLAGGTDGALLRKALAQPATVQVLKQAWEKLATAPQRLATNQVKDASVDLRAILRPAIADLADCRSFGVWQGPTEWAVAIETGAETGDRWMRDWAAAGKVFGAGTPESVEACNAELKVARLADGNVATACGRLGDWVGLAVGKDPAARLKLFSAEVRTALEAGTDAWMELRGNPRALTGCAMLPDADVRITLRGEGERVRTVGTMKFGEPLDLALDPWQLPVDAIHEPLIGFAAGRGMAPVLAKLPVFQRPELAPLPGQFCIWTLGLHPMQTYLAWPADDPGEALKRMAPVLAEEFDRGLSVLHPARVAYQPELNRVVVTNLINAVPFLEAGPEVAPRWIVGGLSLPLYLRGDVGPKELFDQVTNRPDLIWFDWELTQPRLEIMWHLRTFAAMLAGYLPLSPDGAMNAWLRDPGFTECLGNTATEVTLESPTELKLARVSSVGFTAFELTRLAVWLDGENFPLSTPPKTILDLPKTHAAKPVRPTPAVPRTTKPAPRKPAPVRRPTPQR
ncbi:MAG: hypothetical protein KDM81_00090 [Verrucomicrobiae bacterium]|nr:hypothetical protein [Verrucomicrobiae bacterium]